MAAGYPTRRAKMARCKSPVGSSGKYLCGATKCLSWLPGKTVRGHTMSIEPKQNRTPWLWCWPIGSRPTPSFMRKYRPSYRPVLRRARALVLEGWADGSARISLHGNSEEVVGRALRDFSAPIAGYHQAGRPAADQTAIASVQCLCTAQAARHHTTSVRCCRG